MHLTFAFGQNQLHVEKISCIWRNPCTIYQSTSPTSCDEAGPTPCDEVGAVDNATWISPNATGFSPRAMSASIHVFYKHTLFPSLT